MLNYKEEERPPLTSKDILTDAYMRHLESMGIVTEEQIEQHLKEQYPRFYADE